MHGVSLCDLLKMCYFFVSNHFHRGYVSIVSMLVKRGADPLKFNLSGENAFHIAAANGNHEICKLLNHVVAEDPFKKNREGIFKVSHAFWYVSFLKYRENNCRKSIGSWI